MFIIETVITEHCDLRCTYCYIDKKAIHMSTDTFDMLIDNMDDILNCMINQDII
jgi:sulfatase maturation enzyme AslB (radical SAM superfamily)